MQKEYLEKANEISRQIENNKEAISVLEKYIESGTILQTIKKYIYSDGYEPTYNIPFEPWEIRLIVHNKKQRIVALEKQLEEM